MLIALHTQFNQVVSLLLALLVVITVTAQLTVINELWVKADMAVSSPVLKGLYESERNETKENPVFITSDAKRTNELSPDGRLS